MVIVVERGFVDVTEYSAVKGAWTVTSGDCVVYAFRDEEEFRKVFPNAPAFNEHGVASWEEERLEKDSDEEDDNFRPCTCGSGAHWADCKENSPYCG